eukprot:CAMPEP_0117682612 /NCGR_PEP_ID=MMETSP0804-20121206/19790_1 /TAXON_ID=1074897 /ORGANISM="Tetraselmis astigmatica, Strain CCMP880" /LENGTH=45 /DNA_ID= /DNA_START= /DNA_END= /DNA_ORIENTATION=
MEQGMKDVSAGINLVRDKYKAAKIYAGSSEDTKVGSAWQRRPLSR